MDSTGNSILSLCTSDLGGGAENVATTVHRGFIERGWNARMLVGEKKGTDPEVIAMHASSHFDYRTVSAKPTVKFQQAILFKDRMLGREAFHFPYTRWLTSLAGHSNPRAIIAHNLHGGFFDLRMLPGISHQRPFFWFLHDLWSMTGHCAFPKDCSRWETGCGSCPYLDSPPALRFDRTEKNWKLKKEIFKQSRVHVVVPCRWLEQSVKRSILNQAAIDISVIPYGIDLENYTPHPDPEKLRVLMGYDRDEIIGVFVANRPLTNPYKDFDLLNRALAELETKLSQTGLKNKRIRIILVGEEKRNETFISENITLETAVYAAPPEISKFLQMADFYVHPAIQEITPVAIQEAMACGLPVVASDVGGVSEMFQDGEEGILVTSPTSEAWTDALAFIIKDPLRRKQMGDSARQRMEQQGGKETMLDQVEALIRETPSPD